MRSCGRWDSGQTVLETGSPNRRFFDVPVLNDSRREEIGFWLEPEGPGTYRWTVSCSEGDRRAAETGKPCSPVNQG